MKKRIIVVAHYLEIGGAETSLIGLLNALDYNMVDVDLFLYRHTGELLGAVPKEVSLLPEIPAYSVVESTMKDALKSAHLGVTLARVWAKIQFAIYTRKAKPISIDPYYSYLELALAHVLPSLNKLGEYDLALNFIGMPCVVLDKIKAKRKINWIHTDYGRIAVNREKEEPRWLQFDNIVSISKDVTKTFTQVFPSTSLKIVEIENILSPKLIRQHAEEFTVESEICVNCDSVNILSIGRYCEAKRFEAIPQMLSIMRDASLNVHWYIIGYGDDTLINAKIEIYDVEEMITLLGKKSNPYPYIKACDIYVQPSIYEGKSVTVREAQILCKPVAITNYTTAPSQVINGIDGVIVPLDVEECAQGVIELIKNKDKQKALSEYLRTHDYGNEAEVNRIYELLK